ncbi:ribosome recycling factor [Candidatus Saccharibacteria bacterium]|nr:ribosome recycling factor [Candidatus Saccharibacteria bacterium]
MDTAIYTQKFAAAVARFAEETKKIRTGRAHPDMLSGVVVEVYGTRMPLNQVAGISAPEPSQILVTPFDPHSIAAIVAAIRDNKSLGLNPSDDGRNVRVPIPTLTEERRREIVRSLNDKAEEARIALRNIREDARKAAKVKKEAKELSEDDLKRIEKGIDDDVAKHNAKIDEIAKEKETEIMKV